MNPMTIYKVADAFGLNLYPRDGKYVGSMVKAVKIGPFLHPIPADLVVESSTDKQATAICHLGGDLWSYFLYDTDSRQMSMLFFSGKEAGASGKSVIKFASTPEASLKAIVPATKAVYFFNYMNKVWEQDATRNLDKRIKQYHASSVKHRN